MCFSFDYHCVSCFFFYFFFHDTATTEIYTYLHTLSLLDALPISMGEFGATITFVSNIPGETRTLPIAIYTELQVPGGEFAVARLSIIADRKSTRLNSSH